MTIVRLWQTCQERRNCRRRAIRLIVACAARRHFRGCSVNVQDRKSTRLNSSHSQISYAVFCLKKKRNHSPPSSLLLQEGRGLNGRPTLSSAPLRLARRSVHSCSCYHYYSSTALTSVLRLVSR